MTKPESSQKFLIRFPALTLAATVVMLLGSPSFGQKLAEPMEAVLDGSTTQETSAEAHRPGAPPCC